MIVRGYRAGIEENINHPAQCFDKSIAPVKEIQDAYQNGIKTLCFVASSCIYPISAEQPYKEASIFDGKPEESSEPHVMAERACMAMCQSYSREYGCNYFSVMLGDVYGRPESTHFISQIMTRMHMAKIKGLPHVEIWGDGSAIREPLFYKDADRALEFLIEKYKDGGAINVGTGIDFSVAAIARFIKETVGYRGDLVYDCAKPAGASSKRLDITKLKGLGLKAKTNLMDGLLETYSNLLSSLSANA